LTEIIFQLKKTNWLLLLPLTVIALVIVSGPTADVDEAGYYLPLVKWIEQYKVIPGSALFMARTGFNSGFHMLSAIFGFSSLYEGGIYELNGLLFIWFNYFFFSSLIRLIRKETQHFTSDLLLIAALVFPFSYLIDSMDSDYLVIMGGIVINAVFLKQVGGREDSSIKPLIILVMISMMLATMKPFAILLALPSFYIIARSAAYKELSLVIIGCIAFMLPWLIRNIVMTGYLVFPVHFVDLFDFEWEMPKEMTVASYTIVEEYAKVQKIRLDYLLSGVESLSISEWLPTWIAYQKQNLIGWFSLLALPLSAISVFIIFSSKKLKGKNSMKTFASFSLLVLVLWFFSFPSLLLDLDGHGY